MFLTVYRCMSCVFLLNLNLSYLKLGCNSVRTWKALVFIFIYFSEYHLAILTDFIDIIIKIIHHNHLYFICGVA